MKPNINEAPQKNESPEKYVKRMALEKWKSIDTGLPKSKLLLTGDTIVVFKNEILGKPKDSRDARRMIAKLSGGTHQVFSAVCVGKTADKPRTILVKTEVSFRKLWLNEINEYIASRKWQGKAGAYGIQEVGGNFVDEIRGSYTNVVGLPLKQSLGLIEKVLSQGGS